MIICMHLSTYFIYVFVCAQTIVLIYLQLFSAVSVQAQVKKVKILGVDFQGKHILCNIKTIHAIHNLNGRMNKYIDVNGNMHIWKQTLCHTHTYIALQPN